MTSKEIQLIITYEKTGKTIKVDFADYDELKEAIKKIKPSDMNIKDYRMPLTKNNLEFLKKTYRPAFFQCISSPYSIRFFSVPNGIRRTLNYEKTPNNNKTLEKVLKRISDILEKDLAEIDFAFEMVKTELKPTRYHFITIKLVDMLNNLQKLPGKCVIKFDKQKWSYEFVEIYTTRLFKAFTVIKNAFDRKTSPTKNYREKKHENNIK